MKHTALTILLGLGGTFGCSASVFSQTAAADSLAPTYSFTEQQSAWLKSANPAGLSHLTGGVSEAEVNFTKDNGGMVNYYQSDNSFQAGINARSLYRMNDRIVFSGSMGYDYFEGKNMSGSAFINPYGQPFDIVEADESNAGKKKLENYRMMGAVSVEIADGLYAGGQLNFRAANYAKTKDLRHKNKLSQLDLNVGLTYRLSPKWEIGAAYVYNRSTEGITFSMNGTSDIQYASIVSYGAFWGRNEWFGDTGYTKKSEEKPLFNSINGGSLQAAFTPNRRTEIYAEVGVHSRDGYYGDKSSSGVVYSNHNSTIVDFKAALTLKGEGYRHVVSVDGSLESLKNDETVYTSETVNGVTTTRYYSPQRVGSVDTYSVGLDYTGYIGIERQQPTWIVEASAHQYHRKLTASVYPFYRKQSVTNNALSASVERDFIRGINKFSAKLGLGYGFGDGDMAIDGIYATPSSTQTAPKSQSSLLNKEFEYLTTSRYSVAPSVEYTRRINKSVSGYVSAGYRLELAPDAEYLSSDKHHTVNIAVGCLF
jgi:hypothetical protein